MLLKLSSNSFRKIIKPLSICFASMFFSTSLIANESANDSKLQIHGFIAQGVIDVKGSDYVNDDEKPSFELTEIGINASYQLSSDVRLAGQAVYLNGGNRYADGVRIDYLLIDWSLFQSEHWKTNVYLGRFKNYHWLYSSTRDVPMTRPSIILPQSVYFDGTRDLSVGGDGIALASKYFDENIGELDFNLSSGRSPISDEQTRIMMGEQASGDLNFDEDLQASVYWRPHYSSWRFGVALTDADFSYDNKNTDQIFDGKLALERWYANAEYQGENWTFSAELLQEKMSVSGLFFPSLQRSTTGQGGFAQAQYQFSTELQFLMRYERYYANKDDKNGKKLEQMSFGLVPHYFGYQNNVTLGINYNISANLQFQLEHHWIKGTARLTPVITPDARVNENEYWQMSAAQLVYWF